MESRVGLERRYLYAPCGVAYCYIIFHDQARVMKIVESKTVEDLQVTSSQAITHYNYLRSAGYKELIT